MSPSMSRSFASNTLAVVPVRAGSKGLPKKNVRLIAGKPLYQHAVEQALRLVGKCVVTTDIVEILNSPSISGETLVERPSEIARDDTPMDAVLIHLLQLLKRRSELPDHVLLLQATSPLRVDADIEKAIELYSKGEFELLISVTDAEPSILKYGTISEGEFTPVSKPKYCFTNRQSLPKVYRPNGAIYLFSTEFFLRNGGLATNRIGAVIMPSERSIDIDSEDDFIKVEKMMFDLRGHDAGDRATGY